MALSYIKILDADGNVKEVLANLIDEESDRYAQVTQTGFGLETDVTLVSATDPLPTQLYNGGTQLAFAAPGIITFAPTIGTGINAILDSLHTTIITFAGATASQNGSGTIVGAGLWDKDDLGEDARLWLFSRSVTGTTAQDALSVADADMAYCVGFIDFTSWADGAVSRFATPDRAKLPLPYHCTNNGTSLYGILQLIDTGTPTYSAGGLGGFIHVVSD